MKKVLFLLGAIAIVAGTMTSCKKNYTCTCTVSSGGVSQTYTYDLGKIKKADAKTACDNAGNVWILVGGTCSYKVK